MFAHVLAANWAVAKRGPRQNGGVSVPCRRELTRLAHHAHAMQSCKARMTGLRISQRCRVGLLIEEDFEHTLPGSRVTSPREPVLSQDRVEVTFQIAGSLHERRQVEVEDCMKDRPPRTAEEACREFPSGHPSAFGMSACHEPHGRRRQDRNPGLRRRRCDGAHSPGPADVAAITQNEVDTRESGCRMATI